MENAVFAALQQELQAIELPPFLTVSSIGIDGTLYGVEVGGHMRSARLAWWETPPKSWEPLQGWHGRTAALFDSMLPAATPDCC